jgi:crossover junction endodeoxyribonuclease RusA
MRRSAQWIWLWVCVVANRVYVYNLPTPPSVNSLWRISGRRMHRSKKYTEWIGEVALALELEQRPEIDYPFNIEIVVGRPSKRRMDIDNRAKAVMDVLQHCGIIADDCLANRITMMWSNDLDGCKVTISTADVAM